MHTEVFERWIATVETRHLAERTFQEVSRSLRSLSSAYVERRTTLAEGAALSGAGKRAAFALFYGPLHFLLVRHIAASLPDAGRVTGPLTDLGCGTGASGAAWASVCARAPSVVGIDRHPWAVDESRHTYRMFGLKGRTHVGDASRVALAGRGAVLAAFTLNEMAAGARDGMQSRLLAHAERGGAVLIVEPLAGFVAPWWNRWRQAFESAGGRADEWRVRAELPPIVQKLDRAAGLNHREITGRSLWLAGD
ncbi:MAG: hypothetical protein GEU82_12205 [Luteitalea sp.]|nr:hypothetical protein [Luteitalea sp.]